MPLVAVRRELRTTTSSAIRRNEQEECHQQMAEQQAVEKILTMAIFENDRDLLSLQLVDN